MCSKVERKVLEKVDKDRILQEIDILREKSNLINELCEGLVNNGQSLVDAKLREYNQRV